MMQAPEIALRSSTGRVADRLALAFLLVLMAVGSLALWIAVPVGCWRAAAQLASSNAEAYLLALPMTIAAMIGVGALLVWINRLYLRVNGVIARYMAEEAKYGSAPRFLRGPLEPMLLASLFVAIVALVVWFLAFAHSPNPSISAAP